MYEGLGFVRFPEIDFRQGSLEVFGFLLNLDGGPGHSVHLKGQDQGSAQRRS